jgi:uncharacterized protein (DUF433 family)
MLERIAVSPDVMMGKPVIRGTRVTVEIILRKLSEGCSFDDILEQYPNLQRDDLLAALAYGAAVVGEEEMLAH